MSSHKPIKISSQPRMRHEFAKNDGNTIKTSSVDSVKVKLSKNKESTYQVNKKQVSKKIIPQFSKRTTVQIIDSSKVTKKNELPDVKIIDETTRVNVLERIKCASGLPFIYSPLTTLRSDTKTVQTFSFDNKLDQPQFQSSVVLMKDLDKLKSLEIETQCLLLKAKKDIKWKKSQQCKMSAVLNAPLSKVIFSRLQPITFNVEQLMNTDEIRIQNIAEKYAPKKRSKDPEVCLKDFLPFMVIEKIPILALDSFLEQCSQYHINPFTQVRVPEKQSIIPYIMWTL